MGLAQPARVVSGGGARLFSMPLGPLGVTGLLAALDWGAWEWAAANNHSTVGLIAGLLMAPIAVAFAWSLIRVLIALARIALQSAAAETRLASAPAEQAAQERPFDIAAQDERLAA
jgi:TRAP-type C4-dicarboxylate transport system permease small subunit